MTIQSAAREHAKDFRWMQGNPDMNEYEAALRDALALQVEAGDLLAEIAHNANAEGELSWEKIGEIVNVSRLTASNRYRNPIFQGYLRPDTPRGNRG